MPPEKIIEQEKERNLKQMTEIRKNLVAAKDMFENAKRNLIYAAKALDSCGAIFENTTNKTKQTIGDLACSIEVLDEYLTA